MLGRPKIVLASGSPRRLALLNQAGIEPDALRPADVDETPRRGELPRACANRLARAKADAALKSVHLDDDLRGSYILAADTVVAVGRRILPKADLVDEAALSAAEAELQIGASAAGASLSACRRERTQRARWLWTYRLAALDVAQGDYLRAAATLLHLHRTAPTRSLVSRMGAARQKLLETHVSQFR